MPKQQTLGYFLCFVILCLCSSQLYAETEEIKQQETNNETVLSDDKIKISDSIKRKQKVYNTAIDFAQWIDKYFGEAEELESASYDFLRLVNVIGWREGEGVAFRPRIKAKVNLPKIDKKFSLMFADSNEITSNQFNSEQNDDIFLNNKDVYKTSAALNYESDTYNNSKFDTRVGIDSSFDSFVLLKHTYQIYKSETLSLRNFNYLFWKEKERFGVNPRIELDKVINEDNLFRWKYSILRSEKSEGNEWRNTFSFVNRFSKESWLSYDFDIFGASEDEYDIETYRLALRYRRQLDIKWLYFEIEPEVLWQRKPEYSERKFVPGLILRLEVQFEE